MGSSIGSSFRSIPAARLSGWESFPLQSASRHPLGGTGDRILRAGSLLLLSFLLHSEETCSYMVGSRGEGHSSPSSPDDAGMMLLSRIAPYRICWKQRR